MCKLMKVSRSGYYEWLNAPESIRAKEDAELKEFKDLISNKLEAAKKELLYLQGIITRKDELGGDNDDAIHGGR